MSDSPAQLENGHLRIANALFDAWMSASKSLSKREIAVLLVVVRQTYGWNRKEAPMNARIVHEATGIDEANARKAIASLARNGLIRVENQGKKNQSAAIVKDPALWFSGSKRPPVNGSNQPSKTGSKRPPSECAAGRIDPPKEGQNNPLNRVESTPQKSLQPTDDAASSDPKDSKDILKTSTNSPSESYTRARGINVTVSAMTEALSDLSESVARDYLAHRRGLKAPLTPTAWNQIAKAVTETGAPPDDCLAHAMVQGWRGFKADWWANAQRGSRARSPQTFDKQDYSEGLEGFATGMEIS